MDKDLLKRMKVQDDLRHLQFDLPAKAPAVQAKRRAAVRPVRPVRPVCPACRGWGGHFGCPACGGTGNAA